MKSALIIGGNSTLGTALKFALPNHGVEVFATSRNPGEEFFLDLAGDPTSWPELPQCEVAYLCAAITKLDACENDPKATAFINVTRTSEIAKRLHAQGSFVVFLSTNHVFDGSKPHRRYDEPTCPINEYGRQKVATEKAVLEMGNSAVLRLTKIITTPFPMFEQWKQDLRAGKKVQAFDNLGVAPTTLGLAVDALREVGNAKKAGIWQLSAPNDVTYYELAVAIAKKVGAEPTLVEATNSASKNIPANFVPRYVSYENRLPVELTVPEALELI